MKDFKLLLAGLILLLLVIFIGIFLWLWNNNSKHMNPLPIVSNEDINTKISQDNPDDSDTVATHVLYIQAEDKLQTPLDDVISRFESRYPNVQVLAHYVNAKSLLTLPDTTTLDNNNTVNEPSEFLVNIDVIIANDKLTKSQILSLQTLLNEFQGKQHNNKVDVDLDAETSQNNSNNNEARSLVSFSYALKGSQTVDGVILTANPNAVSFRNFLLSSAGQDILKQYDYENIEGYRNNLDDLFNPTSRAKSVSNESSVKVADALSSSK